MEKTVTLIEQLRAGDALHRKAADALAQLEAMSEFILSDTERSLEFVKWQRSRPSLPSNSEEADG